MWFPFLNYFVSDVYEDIGDSDTGSESLQGSDDDFMASDDDDVVIPVSHGQMNTGMLVNLIPLCKPCRCITDSDEPGMFRQRR